MNNPVNYPEEMPALIAAACAKVPPLWPLDSFVAVNPFVGISGMKFHDANSLIKRTRHTEILLPAKYFAERCAAGDVQEEDFLTAKDFLSKILPAHEAQQVVSWQFDSWQKLLSSAIDATPHETHVLTFAEHCDRQLNTNWHSFIIDEVSKWCSSYYDQGQSVWGLPNHEDSLLHTFRSIALEDLNPEMMGLKGFRQILKELPAQADDLIREALQRLQIPKAQTEEFLIRQLMTVSGWSGYVQHQVHRASLIGKTDPSLAELLAIRLSYDLAIYSMHSESADLLKAWLAYHLTLDSQSSKGDSELARLVGHHAIESAYQRKLLAKLAPGRQTSCASPVRPEVQAVFCIDVRSEVFRRNLEQQSEGIETIGFAGFFGMPVDHLLTGESTVKAHCPVLLEPKYRAVERPQEIGGQQGDKTQQARQLHKAWDYFQRSAISCFGFVETCGLGTVLSLTRDTLNLGLNNHAKKSGKLQLTKRNQHCCSAAETSELEITEQINLAAGMLKNMGLRTNFARLVLICGHGSQTKNNPYASALDCGACGGQAGDVNARLAAQILNRADIRAGLADHGIQIPLDTVFVAGLHNTTTDEVMVFDQEDIPHTHASDRQKLLQYLSLAGTSASQERQLLAAGCDTKADSLAQQKARQKANDWSQVRPEWGLAGNASFIAAPRDLTRDVSLAGRAFLHNYTCETDKDDSVLELIMTAPVVVASWINLQYYASRVDNTAFGSGNKATHNVVGTMGIWQGNAGDLQAGLPLQSLHDGTRWMHEPLRLSVIIRARKESINKVLEKHAGVENLFANGWLNLFVLEPKEGDVSRYLGKSRWTGCERQGLGQLDSDLLSLK